MNSFFHQIDFFQSFLTFNQVFSDVWINSGSGTCTRLVNNVNNVSIQDSSSCSDSLKYLCVKSGEMITFEVFCYPNWKKWLCKIEENNNSILFSSLLVCPPGFEWFDGKNCLAVINESVDKTTAQVERSLWIWSQIATYSFFFFYGQNKQNHVKVVLRLTARAL